MSKVYAQDQFCCPASHAPRQISPDSFYAVKDGESPEIPLFCDNEEVIGQYKKHWSAIRSFKWVGSKRVRHVYNYRLHSGDVTEIKQDLLDLLFQMTHRFKANCSF